MYFDVLIHRLNSEGIGCNVLGILISVLVYADDILLLCPSVKGLQRLIKICEEYASDYNLIFNTDKKKSKCIKISKNCSDNVPIIRLYDRPMTWYKKVTYLGHEITYDLSDKDDIEVKRATFFAKYQELSHNYHYLDENVLVYLMKQNCCTFFGGGIYDYSNVNLDRLGNAFKTALRKIFHLPYNSKSKIVLGLGKCTPVEISLYNRFIKLIGNVPDNKIVSFFFRIAKTSFARTVTGWNWIHINNINNWTNKQIVQDKLSGNELYVVNSIRELLSSRNSLDPGSLNNDEISQLIEFLST